MASFEPSRLCATESCKDAPMPLGTSQQAEFKGNSDLKAKLKMIASPLRAGLGRRSPEKMQKEGQPNGNNVVPTASTGVGVRPDAPVFVPGCKDADEAPAGPPIVSLPDRKGAAETPAGPPVVSVRRMPAKGCAIVLLRDKAVLDLSVAMRVAVVDGVCVEVRKHIRKKELAVENAAEEPEGVFVAWGHRVARKVDISEEGLEAYFNGLSTVNQPVGLAIERPFEEQLQSFLLTSGGPLPLSTLPKVDEAVAAKMLDGVHGRPELVQELWDAKEQLDELWNKPPPPLGRNMMQRMARDQLFPHSGKEGEKHENRAGEKLEELSQFVGLLEGVPVGAAFLDLCGGPGAWSQFLLAKPELAMRGFGLTLRSGSGDAADWQSQEKDDWYPDLLQHPKWSALWGADGTGDLLKPKNLEHAASSLKKSGGVFLCVADGGFSDKAIPPNQLELYFYRLFLAELLTSISVLQPGGRFVCKLYTACSDAMAALLFLTTRLFDYVAIVKPMTSRVAGPERYLYASGFRGGAETEAIRAAMVCSQNLGNGASPLQVPLLTPLIAHANLVRDIRFIEQFQTMVSRLCERQAGALRAIVGRANQLEDIAMDAAEKAQTGSGKWAAAAAAQREAAASARREADDNAWNTPTPFRSMDRHARDGRFSGTYSRSRHDNHSGYNSRSGYSTRNDGDHSGRAPVQPRALRFY